MGLLKRIFWSAPSGSDQAEAGPSSERIQQDNSNTAREPDDEPMLMDTAPAKSSPAAPVRGESRTFHTTAKHSSSQSQLSQGGTPRSGPAESQVQHREEPAPRAPVVQSDPRPSSSSSHTIPENLWAPSLDPRARPRLKGAKVMFVEDDQDLLKPDARKEPTKIRKLKPRKYQLALYEQAKSHNIIACLDTGAGKTLVAVMLLQYFNEVELVRTSSQSVSEARTAAFPQVETPLRRIGLFLVTRVPLVDQQAKVIVNNSNLEVTRFSGSDAHQSGTRNAWDTVRRRSDVAVATAQVVLTALMHGFLRMEDIYCIVFDEAHHAFGDEPYAGIMKFYEQYVKKPVPDQPLPRIFGMTASPLKKLGGDEARTSERLESIMKAHILTAPVIHRAELALAVNKPIECIVEYEPPTFFEDSILTKSIREKSHTAKDLLPVLERIEFHTKEHGPLFADIIWATSVNELKKQTATQSALTMINTEWLLEKQSASENRRGQLTSNSRNARLIDDEVRRTFELPDTLTLTNEHVTPKILKLMKILMCFCATEESREGLRGIIFVERRDTAYALHELVRRQENLRWLKTGYVIGHGDGGEAIGLKQGHTSQEAVLSRFRSGEFNLLIATSVIEEGIDVSPCNLIIRFDLFTNHVGFIQSKGRARHKQSKFIMMAERGSEQHYRLIKEVADTDRALRGWLTDLPDDRIHDVRFMAEKDDPDGDLVLEVEETGARLYVQQAVMLLATVHASLVTVDSACHAAQYKSEQLPNCEGFRCTITLPEDWKIPDIVSDVRASKKAAKRLAAFRACEALHKAGKLNAFLRPSASIAKSRKRGMLPLTPTRLQEGVQVQVQQLQSYRGLKLGFDEESNTWKVHATLVRLDKIPQNALNGPCRMMIVLTVDPVSATSEFRLRFTTTDHTFAGLPASSPLTLDSERMEAFRRYTMRLLRWVGRQPQWYCDDMPYILVPATMNAGNARVFDFEKHVDMEEVTRLGQWFTKKVLESGMDVSLGQFYDRILLEKDYEIGAVAYAVTGVTRYKEEYGELERQRSKRRTESGRSKATWKSGIPNVPDEALGMNWFTVSRIERMQNWATGHLEDSTGPKFYHATALPPTNVWVHAISASVYRSGLVMPVILDRIHQALCAQRCNDEIFQGMVGTSHLIEALTVPTAAYSFNYERLEFIGDTFLKLLATAYVFAENIESQEGLLHNARREIIMNRTLLKHCMEHKLDDFMLLQSFSSRAWVPPNFVNPSGGRATTHTISGPRGEGYLPTSFHTRAPVQQKTLADLAESAMGAGLMTDGLSGTLHVSRCLDITPRPVHSLKETAELYREKTAEEIRRHKLDNAFDPGALAELEGFLGYKFRSPHIALQAITHHSINLVGMTFSYERLEFLGDAVLDFLAVKDIYNRHTDFDQGELTEYKDKLCMNRTLGALAEAIGMHRFLNSAPGALQFTIRDANEALRLRRLEEQRKPKDARGIYWAEVKIPKSVADIVESLIGAVALDSSYDMDVLQGMYDRMFKPFYNEFCRPSTEIDDAIREFEKFMYDEGCNKWRYVHDSTYQDDQKVYVTEIHAHNVVWIRSRYCKTRRRSQIEACRNLRDTLHSPSTLDAFRDKCQCTPSGARRETWGATKRKERGH